MLECQWQKPRGLPHAGEWALGGGTELARTRKQQSWTQAELGPGCGGAQAGGGWSECTFSTFHN